MNIGKSLYVTTRRAWRVWLSNYHKSDPEIWLIYYRKDSGKPRISYDDAVLEALAYGWIDSIEKSVDSERFAQRFSPRIPIKSKHLLYRWEFQQLYKQMLMHGNIFKPCQKVINASEWHTSKAGSVTAPVCIAKPLHILLQ